MLESEAIPLGDQQSSEAPGTREKIVAAPRQPHLAA